VEMWLLLLPETRLLEMGHLPRQPTGLDAAAGLPPASVWLPPQISGWAGLAGQMPPDPQGRRRSDSVAEREPLVPHEEGQADSVAERRYPLPHEEGQAESLAG